jgi:hypothetical protein
VIPITTTSIPTASSREEVTAEDNDRSAFILNIVNHHNDDLPRINGPPAFSIKTSYEKNAYWGFTECGHMIGLITVELAGRDPFKFMMTATD